MKTFSPYFASGLVLISVATIIGTRKVPTDGGGVAERSIHAEARLQEPPAASSDDEPLWGTKAVRRASAGERSRKMYKREFESRSYKPDELVQALRQIFSEQGAKETEIAVAENGQGIVIQSPSLAWCNQAIVLLTEIDHPVCEMRSKFVSLQKGDAGDIAAEVNKRFGRDQANIIAVAEPRTNRVFIMEQDSTMALEVCDVIARLDEAASTTEQDVPSNGHKPSNFVPSIGTTAPADAH